MKRCLKLVLLKSNCVVVSIQMGLEIILFVTVGLFYYVVPVKSQFYQPPLYSGPPMPQKMQPIPGQMFQGQRLQGHMMPRHMMPGQMMSGPMVPVPMPLPPAKLPVVVMPYYNKNSNKRRRSKRRKQMKRKSTSSDCESDEASFRSSKKERRRALRSRKGITIGKRREVLTPVISYVTKDGYVVYKKKIKKENARDWLAMSKKKNPSTLTADSVEEFSQNSQEAAQALKVNKSRDRKRFIKKTREN